MGMYTEYEINTTDFIIPDGLSECYEIRSLKNYMECDSKWYEHEDDMKYLSLHNKDVVLVLSGKCEYFGSEINHYGFDEGLWEKTFLNGRLISHKIAKIVMVERSIEGGV